MLKDCLDLPTCEKTLAEAAESVCLLGDIPLSEEDLDILANLLRRKITPNISRGTRYLSSQTPTCLACFLVGMGRFYDKESGYWPVVENKIGLTDLNWQVKWGQIFLNFIERHNLPKFESEEGLTYVTPILGHTGIPYCCLEEYFEQVISPLVRRDLLNPFDREEILYDLNARRKINSNRLELEHQKKRLDNKIRTLRKNKKKITNQIQQLEAVATLLKVEEEYEGKRIALQGLENYEINRTEFSEQINRITEKIRKLESEERSLQGQIMAFDQRNQNILENEPIIGKIVGRSQSVIGELAQAQADEEEIFNELITQWACLSPDDWSDMIGIEISKLSLEQLSNHIKQYSVLSDRLESIRERLESLRDSQKDVKESPRLYSMPLILLGRMMSWLGRQIHSSKLDQVGSVLVNAKGVRSRSDFRTYTQQTKQIKHLQSKYRETSDEIQHQIDIIRVSLVNLPVYDRLLVEESFELYEKLVNLRNVNFKYVEICKQRTELELEYDRLVEEVRGLITSLGISANGYLKKLADILIEVHEEARRSQEAAINAEQILVHQVQPILEDLRSEHRNVLDDLNKLKSKIEELGDGSAQKGLELVKEYHQYHKRIAKIRQDLISLYPEFTLLEEKVVEGRCKDIKTDRQNESVNIDIEIQASEQSRKSSKHDLEYLPIQFPGIDEPIRRFLLYGGTSADCFHVSSSTLFARVISGEEVENIQNPGLSQRVIERFQSWWEYQECQQEISHYREEETDPTTGERFRAPKIVFDISTVEVLVRFPPQRFLRPKRKKTVWLKVYDSDIQESICEFRLKLYSIGKGLVETQPHEFVLPVPCGSYRFLLSDNTHTLHQWESVIPGGGKDYLVFYNDTRKLVRASSFPRASLIILLKNGFTIIPQECILVEGGNLLGKWREFAWYQIDLTNVEEIWLIDDKESKFTLPLASHIGSSFELVEGTRAEGISSDDRSVYIDPPESIRIPVKDRGELALMRVSLRVGDEFNAWQVYHCQVDDLEDVIEDHIAEGWIVIPLNVEQLLGDFPIGTFYLRVFKPPYIDWRSSFCVVPQISVSFDQEIYLPYRDETPVAVATLTLPQNCSYKPKMPAKIIANAGNTWDLQVPNSVNELSGEIIYTTGDGNKLNIPLSIAIPKVQWRLQGLDDFQYEQWLDKIEEEIWIGDWLNAQELFLVVKIPWFYEGKVLLFLPSNSITIDSEEIRDHKVRFDLKALEDSLRAGPSLETITLSLPDSQTNIPNAPLFTVRTRWEAKNIKCFPDLEGAINRLEVTWDETGHVDEKVIRMWHLSQERPHLMQEQKVHKEKYNVIFKYKSKDLISGNYLIHIEPFDLWSPAPALPQDTSRNVVLIQITKETPRETIVIRSVCVDELHSYYLPEGSYKIRISRGKISNRRLPDDLDVDDIEHILVTPLNEDWYAGILEVSGVQEVIAHLHDTNPVKFEFDPHKRAITSIEDRQGDGAVYCYTCNMLFWSQETVMKEKKKKHRNYGPIEQFGVVWKSEE